MIQKSARLLVSKRSEDGHIDSLSRREISKLEIRKLETLRLENSRPRNNELRYTKFEESRERVLITGGSTGSQSEDHNKIAEFFGFLFKKSLQFIRQNKLNGTLNTIRIRLYIQGDWAANRRGWSLADLRDGVHGGHSPMSANFRRRPSMFIGAYRRY